jgi:hypothetical protein
MALAAGVAVAARFCEAVRLKKIQAYWGGEDEGD